MEVCLRVGLVGFPLDYPWEKLEEVVEALSKAGFESWETTIGSAGVTAHNFVST